MFNVPPPTIVDIETTLACPSDCIMCPRREVLATRRDRTMSSENVHKIIDQLAVWKPMVQWGWINEPLADERLFEFIAHGRQLGLKGWINSNGALLNEKNMKQLINSGMFRINFAIDSMDKAKYNKSRKGLDLDDVVGRIKRFIEMNNKCGHPIGVMISQITIPGFNDGEHEAFRKYWAPLVDLVQHPEYRKRGAEWDKKFENIILGRYCFHIENEMPITTDGDVPLCCCDAVVAHPTANVFEVGVVKAWNTTRRARALDKIRKTGMESLGFCRLHTEKN